RDPVRRDAPLLGVLADGLLVRRHVHAVDLVVCHVALDPLDLRPHFAQHPAGLLGDRLQLLRRQLPRSGDVPLDHVFGHDPPPFVRNQSSASSIRSWPQNSSRPTTHVGAPKIPRSQAASVSRRSRCLLPDAVASAIRGPSSWPIDPRMSPITAASEMSRSSAKFARNTRRTNSGSQTCPSPVHATRAASRESLGNTDGLLNGSPYVSHSRSTSRHM